MSLLDAFGKPWITPFDPFFAVLGLPTPFDQAKKVAPDLTKLFVVLAWLLFGVCCVGLYFYFLRPLLSPVIASMRG